jgi:hypothetical protein
VWFGVAKRRWRKTAVPSRARAALVLAAVALVAGASLVAAPRASAATCWQRVISDWRDGSIDGSYSSACLRAALRNLPEDLRVYGSAEEDITRAMTRAVEPAQHRVLAATATRTKPKARTSASTSAPKTTRALSGRAVSKRTRVAAAAAPTKDTGGTALAPARTAIAAAVMGLVALTLAAAVWRARRRGV